MLKGASIVAAPILGPLIVVAANGAVRHHIVLRTSRASLSPFSSAASAEVSSAVVFRGEAAPVRAAAGSR